MANQNRTTVSVSRHTDVPAFYGEWFMQRVAQGFAGWGPPDGGAHGLVSLRPSDVRNFVFWSKNFRPFLVHLRALHRRGYACFLHACITGLPEEFEPSAVPAEYAADTLRQIADLVPAAHVSWRYDPILLSACTPPAYHVERFTQIASLLEGLVARCHIRFAIRDRRNERALARLQDRPELETFDLAPADRAELTADLADIASRHGIAMHACCDAPSAGEAAQRSPCLDALVLGDAEEALGPQQERMARPGCACLHHVDVGRTDTCPGGCAYCVSNPDKRRAYTRYRAQDPHAVFLGLGRAESDRLVATLQAQEQHADAGSATPRA